MPPARIPSLGPLRAMCILQRRNLSIARVLTYASKRSENKATKFTTRSRPIIPTANWKKLPAAAKMIFARPSGWLGMAPVPMC